MLIVLGLLMLFAASVAVLVRWLGWATGGLAAVAAVVVLLALYMTVIRPWHLTWGATGIEIQAAMPGDDLMPDATVSKRAVTIAGSPSEVWPWLVQIGFGRAGWYSSTG
jgi:hypothetical protein